MIQVQQRHKYARLLGYSNYAEYAVDVRMAKTPMKVCKIIVDVVMYLPLEALESQLD